MADAIFRNSPAWKTLGLADPDKVEKFARFLARHFYYERVVHFFKYSTALARFTGRRPEQVVAGAAMDELFPTLVLGSRGAAQRVAGLVADHVLSSPSAGSIEYLQDLLRYEQAMMVAEAGPRVWRERDRKGHPAGAPQIQAAETPAKAVIDVEPATHLLQLDHDIPEILGPLLAAPAELPVASRRPVRLVVARSAHGRVVVARSNEAIEALLTLADGTTTLEQVIASSSMPELQLREALSELTEWGAVKVFPGS